MAIFHSGNKKHYWELEYLKVTVSSRTAILCICKQCVVVDPGFCVGLDQRDKIHGIVKAKGTTTAYSVLGSRGHFCVLDIRVRSLKARVLYGTGRITLGVPKRV